MNETIEYYDKLLGLVDDAAESLVAAIQHIEDRVNKAKLSEIEAMLSDLYNELEAEQESYLEHQEQLADYKNEQSLFFAGHQ